MCLELLLFGFFDIAPTDDAETVATLGLLPEKTALAPILLSRRARGKAIDRLIIDYIHMERQRVASADKKAKKAASDAIQKLVSSFCEQIITSTANSGSIGFSSIRTVARRLKQPLAESLRHVECLESEILGLRFENEDEATGTKSKLKKYSDWTPITDRSIANALKNEETGPGGRCAFVGFEDEGDQARVGTSSLNVEELAMELYRCGRLPNDSASAHLSHGGWMVRVCF